MLSISLVGLWIIEPTDDGDQEIQRLLVAAGSSCKEIPVQDPSQPATQEDRK